MSSCPTLRNNLWNVYDNKGLTRKIFRPYRKNKWYWPAKPTSPISHSLLYSDRNSLTALDRIITQFRTMSSSSHCPPRICTVLVRARRLNHQSFERDLFLILSSSPLPAWTARLEQSGRQVSLCAWKLSRQDKSLFLGGAISNLR